MALNEENFDLHVTGDGMAVLLSCEVDPGRTEELLERVEGLLRGLGLAETPTLEVIGRRIAEALAQSGGNTTITELPLVEGTTPTPPRHGRIEWAGEFFAEGFVTDERDAIDYRRRRANPSVKEGQLLARLIPRVEGSNGKDVFGNPVPAEKAVPARLRAGKGVRFDEDNTRCYASTTGRVRFTAGVLNVDEVFSVPGNVNLESGHISHPGAVVIDGDIEAESKVEADGDITVGGLIESADVTAGGSIEVRGGISGFLSEPIRAKGSVSAKFIMEARVVAEGDVLVDREVTLSEIRTGNSLLAPEGRLVGGKVKARRTVDVAYLGSDAAAKTSVAVGRVGDSAEKLAAKERELESLREQLAKIHRTVDPLMKRHEDMPPAKREAVTQLLSMEDRLEDDIGQGEDELDEMRGGPRPQVIVRKQLYPETTIQVDFGVLRIREAMTGPLRAVYSKGEVAILPYRGK